MTFQTVWQTGRFASAVVGFLCEMITSHQRASFPGQITLIIKKSLFNRQIDQLLGIFSVVITKTIAKTSFQKRCNLRLLGHFSVVCGLCQILLRQSYYLYF